MSIKRDDAEWFAKMLYEAFEKAKQNNVVCGDLGSTLLDGEWDMVAIAQWMLARLSPVHDMPEEMWDLDDSQ